MNWQLFSNVNPPVNQKLLIHNDECGWFKFAIREDNGHIRIHDNHAANELARPYIRMEYDFYRESYGRHVFWCLLKEPNE